MDNEETILIAFTGNFIFILCWTRSKSKVNWNDSITDYMKLFWKATSIFFASMLYWRKIFRQIKLIPSFFIQCLQIPECIFYNTSHMSFNLPFFIALQRWKKLKLWFLKIRFYKIFKRFDWYSADLLSILYT